MAEGLGAMPVVVVVAALVADNPRALSWAVPSGLARNHIRNLRVLFDRLVHSLLAVSYGCRLLCLGEPGGGI